MFRWAAEVLGWGVMVTGGMYVLVVAVTSLTHFAFRRLKNQALLWKILNEYYRRKHESAGK